MLREQAQKNNKERLGKQIKETKQHNASKAPEGKNSNKDAATKNQDQSSNGSDAMQVDSPSNGH